MLVDVEDGGATNSVARVVKAGELAWTADRAGFGPEPCLPVGRGSDAGSPNPANKAGSLSGLGSTSKVGSPNLANRAGSPSCAHGAEGIGVPLGPRWGAVDSGPSASPRGEVGFTPGPNIGLGESLHDGAHVTNMVLPSSQSNFKAPPT